MANDMNSAVDMLQDLLSSPDAGERISSMLSAFGGDSDNNDNDSVPDLSGIMSMFSDSGIMSSSQNKEQGDAGLPMASMLKLANAYKQLNGAEDTRTNLLRAIKPYLQTHRHKNLDQAIKMLGFLKLMPLMGEFKGLL